MNNMVTVGRTLLFHWLGWHGKLGLPSPTGYDSRDPNVIGNQLSAMQALAWVLGFKSYGVIALTYGPTASTFIHTAVMEMSRQCSNRNLPFALCLDPWVLSSNGVKFTAQADKDAAMIAALNHPDTQTMLNGRSYLPGKTVLDFTQVGAGANKATVLAAVKGIQIWQNGPDFAWPRIGGTTNNNVTLPCVCLQFDDGTGANRNMSHWDQTQPVRIIPARAGSYYWDLADQIPAAAQYIQLVTWNDASNGEQTDVEKFAAMIWGRI